MTDLHTNRALMTILLVIFTVGFILLGILSLLEYEHPLSHYMELLFHDRIVQIIMLDFLFFFIWVVLWMIDCGRKSGRSAIGWIPLGLIAASLMIYLYVITERKDRSSS